MPYKGQLISPATMPPAAITQRAQSLGLAHASRPMYSNGTIFVQCTHSHTQYCNVLDFWRWRLSNVEVSMHDARQYYVMASCKCFQHLLSDRMQAVVIASKAEDNSLPQSKGNAMSKSTRIYLEFRQVHKPKHISSCSGTQRLVPMYAQGSKTPLYTVHLQQESSVQTKT